MKTATPPKGVTARWVSRRITRSPESRAVISCGTSLSEVFASTPLYRKHLRAMYSSASEFRIKRTSSVRPLPPKVTFPQSPRSSHDPSESYGRSCCEHQRLLDRPAPRYNASPVDP